MTITSTAAVAAERQDLYSCIREKIVASLPEDMRLWIKTWNNAHAAGPITKPMRGKFGLRGKPGLEPDFDDIQPPGESPADLDWAARKADVNKPSI